MIGELKNTATIVGEVSEEASITGIVKSSSVLADVETGGINIIHTDLPDYEGRYYVEPKARVQTLLTTNKTMRHNLVVDSIQIRERPNIYGGLTVYIGEGE